MITVSQLIEKLSKFDGEMQVVVVRDDGAWEDINSYAIQAGFLDEEDILQPEATGDMVGIGIG